MNIVLIGLMASGKSTVGQRVAELTGRPFVDTDALVEEQAGCTIAELFATEGEAGFRDRESAAIRAATARDGQVIATGGGAVLRPENREALRASGLVFWLDAPPEVLYRRVMRAGAARRPLLAAGDALERLRTLAEVRREAYALSAHYRVEVAGKQLRTVARIIMDKLKGDHLYAASQRQPGRP